MFYKPSIISDSSLGIVARLSILIKALMRFFYAVERQVILPENRLVLLSIAYFRHRLIYID
ncbi:hypothetical protein SCFA_1420003 [anaerobic digester metagenome]|uniref:Uncharacterized protein n=1 Tax=anaerobic digester metagenome TaxID=1263854 RepID=A0A485LUS4_9ZZZZ